MHEECTTDVNSGTEFRRSEQILRRAILDATSNAIFHPVEHETAPERSFRALWQHLGRPERPCRALAAPGQTRVSISSALATPEQDPRGISSALAALGQARAAISSALAAVGQARAAFLRALRKHWGKPERLSRAPNGSGAVTTNIRSLERLNASKCTRRGPHSFPRIDMAMSILCCDDFIENLRTTEH